VTTEPSEAWRATLDGILEHPAAWRHIAVQAELASRRHPEGWVSHRALKRLSWAAADLAFLTAGELPAEAILTRAPDAGDWARHVFTEREARDANYQDTLYRRGKRGPLTAKEAAARRQYKRHRERLKAAS